jgi:hypothetical protein
MRLKEIPPRRQIGRRTLKPQALPVHPWSKHHGRRLSAQIIGRRLSGTAVRNDIKTHGLPLIEGAQTGAFDRADMDKDIIPAIRWLNEAKALLVVEPLYSSRSHKMSFR